jgi:hypothetical protein
MFLAVGDDLPAGAWDGIAAGPAKSQVMPSPVVWFKFRDAMRTATRNLPAEKPLVIGSAGLSGVTRISQTGAAVRDVPPGAAKAISYALQAAGDSSPEQGVSVIYEVVGALKTLGLERLARKLAVETLLKAGL